MIDKSLSIFLMIIFGMSGITILTLAWLEPLPASERIMTTLIGSIGLFVSFTRALQIRSLPPETNTEQRLVKAEVKENPFRQQ